MQIKELNVKFQDLQKKFWDENLDAVCWAWNIDNPDICLVFMNPTWKNVSSSKDWKGLKAPWLWTKNIWKMLFGLGFISEKLFDSINSKKPEDWDYDFCNNVYSEINERNIYITNLSKATQIDARPLSNSVFREYLDLFYEELSVINPRVIITFGNQVSSIVLKKNIKVSESRKECNFLDLNWNKLKVFPVFYPVWQWMRNINKAKEDIDWILKNKL